jgi:hypothetical protein
VPGALSHDGHLSARVAGSRDGDAKPMRSRRR